MGTMQSLVIWCNLITLHNCFSFTAGLVIMVIIEGYSQDSGSGHDKPTLCTENLSSAKDCSSQQNEWYGSLPKAITPNFLHFQNNRV
jgi:hypothetical protein